jgi:hypothetical protein
MQRWTAPVRRDGGYTSARGRTHSNDDIDGVSGFVRDVCAGSTKGPISELSSGPEFDLESERLATANGDPKAVLCQRRFTAVSRRCRLATIALVVGWLSGAVTLLMGVSAQSPAGAADAKPTPGHLIVGGAISLPSSLIEPDQAGSNPSPLVTSSQANVVAKTMWQLWENAMVTSDTRALAQLIAPGPMLQGTLNNCAFPAGTCAPETQPRPIDSLTTAVPIQHNFPIYFLAEIGTKELVTGDNNLSSWQPWQEVQILTKESPSDSWKLSFDSGYNAPGGSAAPALPIASAVVPGIQGTYNPAPSQPSPIATGQYLSQLGSYWQSFIDTGNGPSDSAFVNDGDTSGFGQQLATNPPGSIYAGSREWVSFSAPFSGQSWVFSTNGGHSMVCGAVVATQTDTPATTSGSLYQNSDETNYGITLPPGLYSRIVSERAHETCVYSVTGGLDALAGSYFDYAVSGTKLSKQPLVPKSSGLSDLETAYGVLGDQLSGYLEKLKACERGGSSPCSTAFAKNAAYQFGTFSAALGSYGFPSGAQSKVNSLEQSAALLSGLFSGLEQTPQKSRLATAGLVNALTKFQQQYASLRDELERSQENPSNSST